MTDEIWKVIDGYPEYQVSNLGRLKSFGGKSRNKILGQFVNKNWPYWYSSFGLYRKTFRVHRLIAQAFIPNPNNYPEINHKDGNGLNNSLENLEWVSKSQNVQHSWDRGKRKISYHRAKLTPEEVFEIRCLKYYGATNSKIVGDAYGLDRSTITNIWSGRTWSNV